MTSSSEQSATTPEPRYVEIGDIIEILQSELTPRLYASFADEIENALNKSSLATYEIARQRQAPNIVELYQLILIAAQKATPGRIDIKHATRDETNCLLLSASRPISLTVTINDSPIDPLLRIVDAAYWQGSNDQKKATAQAILTQFKLDL